MTEESSNDEERSSALLKFANETFFISRDEDTDPPWYLLIQNLSYDQLEALRCTFKSKNEDETLNKEEFVSAIIEVCGHSNYSSESNALFEEISKNAKIKWSEFLDFLLDNLMPTSLSNVYLHLTDIIAVPHTKRETIVKIVLIETDKYFCYAMVSKHGRVGLYDGNLNFLTTYHLIMTREDINLKEEQRRRRNRWVTDAIFCIDIQMFIVTNTARSIVIYEASGLKHVPLWLILSTPNIVECFAYRSGAGKNGENTLYMGDDSGKIFSFNFMQPKPSLLRKKHNDNINLFYWGELPDEKDFIVIKNHGRPYKEAVKHLRYFDDNETLLSCSRDQNVSLMIKYIGNKNRPYVFKMPKGSNCFALSRFRKILITGSENGIIRMWNPIITSNAIATLTEHKMCIVDLQIMEKQNLFLSCSSDGVLNLWDIEHQKCIQSVTINFPSFNIFGKLIEWGIQSIYPGPKRVFSDINNLEVWERSQILISCCNYIAIIKLTFQDLKIQENFEMHVLPPPPLQNSVLVPNMWKTSDSLDESHSEKDRPEVDMEIIKKRLEELKFILQKDFFEDSGSKSDINFKIATLERKKLQMQEHIARGAPYLALNLYDVESLHLTPNLPVPNRRKIKNIAESVEKILEDANARDLIFSERSSTRSPRSSRSSMVEFEY